MQNFNKIKKLFWRAIISFLVMSLSILLMPFASGLAEATNNISLIVVGGLFWLNCITGVACMLYVGTKRKSYFRKMKKKKLLNEEISKNKIAWCIPAKLAGCTTVISLILFIISLFTNLKYEYISFIILFALVFSMCMYFIFNGKNYRFIKQIKGEEHKHEEV